MNGAGKTTSIGKLANRLRKDNFSVMLCAADTFRAAAVEQLEIWAHRNGIEVIKQKSGADPAAVVYDAVAAAKARATDALIVDTAGRLHTKSNLMAELEKMKRTAAKVIPGAPHDVLLVLDATTGQNGLAQAREFTSSVRVTGIILTKLDGTAKGGIVVAIARELGSADSFRRHRRTDQRSRSFRLRNLRQFAFRLIIVNSHDIRFMDHALDFARKGIGLASPNPTVGCVIVRDGEIVGQGFHQYE